MSGRRRPGRQPAATKPKSAPPLPQQAPAKHQPTTGNHADHHEESFGDINRAGLKRVLKVGWSLVYFATIFGAALLIEMAGHRLPEEASDVYKSLLHALGYFLMGADALIFVLYTLSELWHALTATELSQALLAAWRNR